MISKHVDFFPQYSYSFSRTLDLSSLSLTIMPLKSDIHINVANFEPSNTSAGTAKANEDLINLLRDGPKWFEVWLSVYM